VVVVAGMWLQPFSAVAQDRTSPAPAVAIAPLPRGEVIDPVPSLADPELSYALYVPTVPPPERGWPVLFILDARGRGALTAGLFREAAERYGWIVASSNDSMSDGPSEPNVRAIKALLADMEHQFTIDPHRAYFAGFSGTAREVWTFALAMPESVAGVIVSGGAYPLPTPPTPDLSFAVFGAAGRTDFNYQEMQSAADTLDALHLPYRVEVFEGGHSWPPPEMCTEAVAWMELQAMKKGLRPRDDALVERLYDAWWSRARASEEGGDPAAAAHGYREVARDFAGLRDVGEAVEAADRLGATDAVTTWVAGRERAAAWEEARRSEVFDLIAVLRDSRSISLEAQAESRSIIRQLERHAARDEDPQQAEAAQRALELFFVVLSSYQPRKLFERGDYESALVLLRLAAEIHEDHPIVWYNIAACEARVGSRKRALDALERSVQLGFGDRAYLEADEDFASVRDEERYQAIVAGMAQ